MDTLTRNRLSLSDMISDLRKIDDKTWGQYAFSRDILKDRIPNEEKFEMIDKSIKCGNEYADKILQETGQIVPQEIAKHLGLHVMFRALPMTEKRVLFAQFTPPNQIEISQEPIEKYKTIAESAEGFDPLITESEIQNLLLGHEIFHFLEDQYEDEIYTRTKKIQLWHILNFKNDTTIRALGEIAGMAFSKRLNHTDYSPLLLDVLLFFGYNSKESTNIYWDIMDMKAKQKI